MPKSIAVVVDQRMFGGQLRMSAIILIDPAAGREERLEERHLPVLVEVGSRVGDRVGEILAEPGEVLLVAALGRGDDDAVRPERRLRNGPLAEAQLRITTGRLTGPAIQRVPGPSRRVRAG